LYSRIWLTEVSPTYGFILSKKKKIYQTYSSKTRRTLAGQVLQMCSFSLLPRGAQGKGRHGPCCELSSP